MRSRPPSVLLTTDGAYPCYRGGVSVWCDQLIRRLSDVDFHLFAITNSPEQTPIWELRENVRTCRLAPLWGMEGPGSESDLTPKAYLRQLGTTGEVIPDNFLEPFEITIRALLSSESSPEELAGGLLHLHLYFRNSAYAWTMASPEAWDAFLRCCRDSFLHAGKLSLAEAIDCMRWLQRYLAIVTLPYPAVDITHASTAGLAGIPGVLAKLLQGSRFLITEHRVHLRECYLYLGRADCELAVKRFLLSLNEALVRMNYHYADVISSPCAFNQKWQIRLGAEAGKVRWTPHGVDPERFAPREPGERKRPTVLTVARFSPWKGIDVLLRAAALVRAQIPEARFQILGEAPDREYFETCLALRSTLGLNSSVEFGETADSASAYHQADVFCLPSVSEGAPYSLLEAMFSGRPVVATDVGGVAETLGDTGLLVKPNDPEDLARALIFVLEDGEAGAARRVTFSTAVLARARLHYTAQQSAEHFRQLYYSLLYEDSELSAAAAAGSVAVTGAGCS
ncbi:MAG: GT4 family glycosyltransferase PelF [Acidobacteria bacterium]|nr:GT4 family glycosyltransferase PelF [Acidobacteriota bacterium]